MELMMNDNMLVMQCASKFTELDFVASKKMKMRRFEEGLAFYFQI